jgi:mxaA protein
MTTLITKLLLLITLLFQSGIVSADNKTLTFSSLKNPQRSSGIQMGDVLKRSVMFETEISQKALYKALPAKGTRNDEVELISSNIFTLKEGSKNQYKLELVYQVFTNFTKPKVMALPEETIKISSSDARLESNPSSICGAPIIIPPPWMYSNAARVLVPAGE